MGTNEDRPRPAPPRGRAILHVDMDAFYASVEELDDPSLRGKPLVVGGRSRRSVVAAASYAARPFGLRSAMPMMEALRLCPDVIVIPPRMARYAEVSESVFAIFRRFTPLVEGLSLDEAFLDVTQSHSLFGDGETIARRIKSEIKSELGLTASAGVAPCKFVAKIASDLRKPDGLVVVRAGEEAAFLAPLPIERMWGVGVKTAPKLKDLGLHTLGDLARATATQVEQLLGSWGTEARDLARGKDDRSVDPDRDAKSVGAEETYEQDLTCRDAIRKTLLDHAARVAQRMTKEGLWARVVVVKLKYADFTLKTRRIALPEPVADTGSIYDAARKLLDRFDLDRRRVRLTGVSVTDISDGPPAATLFPDAAAAKRRKLEEVILRVAGRYADGGITRAELLDPESVGPPRGPEADE